ncbi:MAG: MEKHLA domain-containing protein [Planctomyces sp.]|jgi:putative N6-adenine-specific DNA methylase|nr:MEKHLA domain-containing protein [Planctomyces sp.]
MPRFDLIATATFGLESVVARELERLGYTGLRVVDGKVHFQGDERDIARCNLWLRSADRLLIRVGEFPAPDFDALFDQTKALPWSDLLPVDAKFPVAGRSVLSRLHAVPAIQGAVKKAIVESLKRTYQRFRFDESGSTFQIEVSLLRDVATLTIDTSGDGLHKRGYREFVGLAPLRETMAAGLIQLSYWNRDRQFVDPFCGSGTLPIEAALIGRNIAPGIGRSFVAEDWRWLDRRIWREVRTEARDLRQPRMVLPILGFDHDPSAIRLSEKGANEAGVAGDIQFRCQEVSDFRTNAEYGVVITNPPYGERLGDPEEVAAVYRELGRVTASLPTWGVYAITSNRGFEQQFGRRAPRRRKLFNGRLECQFYQYPGPPPRRADGSAEIPAETPETVDTVETPITATAEPQEIWQTSEWLQQAQLMLDSYSRHTGRQLLERSDDPIDEARRLYHAPFVVVSHGTQADPILNYGNLLAQQLWEMDAQTLTSIPSRLTAEPTHRDERAEMMARALRDGFVDDYRGIRISRTGKRFLIERAVIWNLQDAAGRRLGQAATFSEWKPLDPGSPPADSAETTVAPKRSD